MSITDDVTRYEIVSRYLNNQTDAEFDRLIRKILQTPESQQYIFQHRFYFTLQDEDEIERLRERFGEGAVEDRDHAVASLEHVLESGNPIGPLSDEELEVDLSLIAPQDYGPEKHEDYQS
jgi:hypothetical protein